MRPYWSARHSIILQWTWLTKTGWDLEVDVGCQENWLTLEEVGSNDISYEESGTNAEMFSVWDSDSD